MEVRIEANKLLALQEFASTDHTRFAMNGINVAITDKVTLRATDGHVAGRMVTDAEIHGKEGNFTVHFSRDHLKLLKAAKRDYVTLTVEGDMISVAFDNGNVLKAQAVDLPFPNMDRVYPDTVEGTVSHIHLNVDLLMRFSRCKILLNGNSRSKGIKMQFIDELSPVYITLAEYDFEGLIMPMRD